MDRELFSSQPAPPATDSVNRAGGRAYEFSDKEKLAQYCATGFFGNTYYVSAKEQLTEVRALAEKLPSEFVAKCAVYARKHAYLKDVPAFLVAMLASRPGEQDDLLGDGAVTPWFAWAFERVIDNAKMLSNFCQVIKSGAAGRKGFGHVPRRVIGAWLASRSLDGLFRDSVGITPGIDDIVKIVRPSREVIGPEREALFGYLTGPLTRKHKPRTKDGKFDIVKMNDLIARQQRLDLPYSFDDAAEELTRTRYNEAQLPALVRQFETFKAARRASGKSIGVEVPDVPFRMLDSLPLTDADWTQVARTAGWQMTRMNLNTFMRHGVFKDPGMTKLIADRLMDQEQIAKSRVFPYQLFAAFKNADENVPELIKGALEHAVELSVMNIPEFPGKTVMCVDTSGSMRSPISGDRKGGTSKMMYIDAAAVIGATVLRRAPESINFAFDTGLYQLNDRNISVLKMADQLSKFGGGGTSCELPLRRLNEKKETNINAVVFASDNESWYANAHYDRHSSPMMQEWATLKRRNPKAKLICIDIAAATSTQAPGGTDRLNIGGFSDAVFSIIHSFLSGETKSWVEVIESLDTASGQ